MTITPSLQRLLKENEQLRAEVEHLRDELIRLIGHNLDISERLEDCYDVRRRAQVAREIFSINQERQRNADLQDDAQLLAIIELRMEEENVLIGPDYGAADMAQLIGVSVDRLNRLFRHHTLYRTPDGYLDNLRLIKALRLLRGKPQYSIAAVAQEAGFNSVRTFQRRMHEVVGMTPVEYRLLLARSAE